MKQELEIEFKNMLTQEEFQAAAHYFALPPHAFQTQANHYFDTSSFDLKSEGCALRIREKHGRFVLTLKQPQDDAILETHEALSETETEGILSGAVIPKNSIYQIISSLGIAPEELKYFGTLKTTRAEAPYKNGTIVLDHSTYLGQEDFELEYEAEEREEGKTNFFQMLKTLNIPVRPAENKVRRFYRAKFGR
ncbi:CYTH domain-containing protein [Peribacillus kribbensis]|uniref:CYTH domain-containing protein n=1 Tax=Peribacillus kribbensis TaxID=356658 RepID=UPI00042024DC|nr:CYTH domain-containing protein [Peribacillus kribbensis]